MKFAETEERKQKDDLSIEQNTNHTYEYGDK